MIGNIAKTIEMISEKVDEPFINQQHLDELEQLRTHIDEETGIKATHEEGIYIQWKLLDLCKRY